MEEKRRSSVVNELRVIHTVIEIDGRKIRRELKRTGLLHRAMAEVRARPGENAALLIRGRQPTTAKAFCYCGGHPKGWVSIEGCPIIVLEAVGRLLAGDRAGLPR